MPAEFDPYAEKYDKVLAHSLGTAGDVDRFAAYKVDEVACRVDARNVARVLDFGCGVGRSLPHLVSAFAGSEVWGYEPSEQCALAALQRAPTSHVMTEWSAIPAGAFDCVLAANVFHHIPATEQVAALRRCGGALSAAGSLFVFEHNPINPLTRIVFERCPFDRDAAMIARRRMIALGAEAGLRVRRTAFTLFVPFGGRVAGALQHALAWLPLGAQYYVQFVR
jgi:2-polyprenyl-3-methyl-5-hydroxy-6-metoxy-1,4-benzoquinol methylase